MGYCTRREGYNYIEKCICVCSLHPPRGGIMHLRGLRLPPKWHASSLSHIFLYTKELKEYRPQMCAQSTIVYTLSWRKTIYFLCYAYRSKKKSSVKFSIVDVLKSVLMWQLCVYRSVRHHGTSVVVPVQFPKDEIERNSLWPIGIMIGLVFAYSSSGRSRLHSFLVTSQYKDE